MHAGAPETRPRRGSRQVPTRRTRRPRTLWHRRRDLYRGPFLHPAVRLSVVDGEAQSRSAAPRSGGACQSGLRRLRPVWRGRARRGAVPVLLARRDRAQPKHARHHRGALAPAHHRLARRSHRRRGRAGAGGMIPGSQPGGALVKILIAALGGEGGAVLTNWIVAAADALGYPVQSTSIPGVAQRTGATTYYIEMLPQAVLAGDKRPVMALVPGIGDVDLVVTSELLEAGRAIGGGFVTPDRTMTVASTHRIYAMAEKIEMGDGRLDADKLLRAIAENSQSVLLFDMDDIAQRNGAMINAVMLGALAGTGRLPLSEAALAAAIEAEGKAAEANLRGFRAGLAAARQTQAEASAALAGTGQIAYFPTQDEFAGFPDATRQIVAEGVRRLTAYQDAAYA